MPPLRLPGCRRRSGRRVSAALAAPQHVVDDPVRRLFRRRRREIDVDGKAAAHGSYEGSGEKSGKDERRTKHGPALPESRRSDPSAHCTTARTLSWMTRLTRSSRMSQLTSRLYPNTSSLG